MSRKQKKRGKKVESTSESFYLSCPIDDDDINEALSMEFYDCCCFDCTTVDFGQFHGKINFSLDNLCCEFSPDKYFDKKPKKKKSKKKSGTPSPVCDELEPHIPNVERASKSISPKTFNLDTISDQHLNSSSRSFSTNDLPGFKGSTSLKLKKTKHSKKSTKLCNTLKNEAVASSFQNLCNRFKSSSLSNLLPITTTDTVKNIVQLSDHDRKILDRMSMKNLKELALVENSIMARRFWESEKSEREKEKHEQHVRYLRMVNEKRKQEHAELMRRKQLIDEKEKEYCERVQNDIEAKTIKAENILKNIEMEREMSECRKRQREYQRMEAIQTNCEESKLDEQIWREAINERLEERIHKAEDIRSKNLDVYRIRVQTDNQIHQQVHAQKYDQAIRDEIHKRDQLRERIKARESKFRKFDEERQKSVLESKSQAKTSALLRELVRQSFGSFKVPSDTPSQMQRGSENGRFSHCSYTSQVSHIHLS